MELNVGTRWNSACCTTQVIVVRAPAGEVSLECGGIPMHAFDPGSEHAPEGSPLPPFDEGTAIGKRYRHDDLGIEVLCTKPGTGSLSLGGTPIPQAESKALPASD